MSSTSPTGNRKRLRTASRNKDSDTEDEFPPCKTRKSETTASLNFKEKLQSFTHWVSGTTIANFFKLSSAMPLKSGTLLDGRKEIHPMYRRRIGENGHLSSRFNSININGSQNGNSEDKSRIPDYRSYKPYNRLKRTTVSNPPTEMEALLGAKPEVPVPEADEIEILSELPGAKHVTSRKALHVSDSSTLKSSSVSNSKIPSPHKLSSSASKSFTADVVMRLEEKENYRKLIDRYITGGFYHTVTKKEPPKPQIDESLSSVYPKLLTSFHFKKEILHQNIDSYIERCYKPCILVPSKDKQTKDKVPPEIQIDDDDEDDDELQILEVKLPTCKGMIKSKKYFSQEWLAQLRETVQAQTNERLKIVEEQELALEHIRRERLLKRIRSDISKSVEPEFPELTPEMEEAVDQALAVGNPDDEICKITSDILYRKDFETLGGLNWLNDLIINSYFDLIVLRSKKGGLPSVYAYTTFFYTKYKNEGYSMVKRWTRKVDIFSYDLNFVPIHLSVHWCLAVIDHRSKKICYYDSMGNGEERCLDLLLEYLCIEHLDKKGTALDPSTYTTEIMKDIPQQMNGSDCGMFTVKYAEYISRGVEITFNQSHMHYFRRRMVYELLNAQLL